MSSSPSCRVHALSASGRLRTSHATPSPRRHSIVSRLSTLIVGLRTIAPGPVPGQTARVDRGAAWACPARQPGRDRRRCGRQDGPAAENHHGPDRTAGRGRAERARGRAVRGPGHRRGALALRGGGRAARLPAAPLLPRLERRRPAGRGPAGAARPADDAGRRDLRRVAGHQRGHPPARARGGPVGGRLRRPRARGGRPRAHAGRSRARRVSTPSTASARPPGATCTWAATPRAACSATRWPPIGATTASAR